jgi:putative transposase
MMMQLIDEHAPTLGVAALCDALNVPRASYYRWKCPVLGPHRPRSSPRALSAAERGEILDLVHEPRFVDRAPAEIVATLLDDGSYRCSERTMYRILAAAGEVRERRDQLRRPTYVKPELLATRPNELWSWDITKLHGPAKWTYFYLYVILDVFSRYVVGWMVALEESAALAQELLRTTCERQGITAAQLTIHADRGASMTSKPVALLLSDLGVTKTHSRPYTSNDNPFSEAAFKTLKYRPGFPERFGAVEDARLHCAAFFDWYNLEHHHSGLAMLTPHDVHHGLADERTAQRAAVLAAAHRAHPERFVHGPPTPHTPPREVWINPPPRHGDKSPPKASETPPALGVAEAGGGAEVQGPGGAAPVVTTEEVRL